MAVQPKPGVQESESCCICLTTPISLRASKSPSPCRKWVSPMRFAIARSNVPRAIAGLKDDGVLVERQAHVKGVSRKRKAYFLTDSGTLLAGDTWGRLSEYPVRCILDDQPPIDTTLGGAKSVLPFEMRPVDILRYLDEHGCLGPYAPSPQISWSVTFRSTSRSNSSLHWRICLACATSTEEKPNWTTWSICSRREQRPFSFPVLQVSVRRPWLPNSLNASCIVAISSTTGAKIGKAPGRSSNPLLIGFPAWGIRTFTTYLAATPIPQPADAARLLIEALEGSPSLIVIDDFHKVSDLGPPPNLPGPCPWPYWAARRKLAWSCFLGPSSRLFPPRTPKGGSPAWSCPSTVSTPIQAGNSSAVSANSATNNGLHIHGLSQWPPLGAGTHQSRRFGRCLPRNP